MRTETINGLLSFVLVMMSTVFVNAHAEINANNVIKTPNLVIYRPSQNVALQRAYFRVSVDGKWIGKLKDRSYYALNLEKGVHTISANDGTKNQIKVTITDEGKIFVSAVVKRKPSYHMAFTRSSSKKIRSEDPKLYAQFIEKQSVREGGSIAINEKGNRF